MAKDILACFKDSVQFVGIWDDGLEEGTRFEGLSVLGKIDDIPVSLEHSLIMAIGNPGIREKVYNKLLARGLQVESLIHASAQIFNPETVNLEPGLIMMPFSYITTQSSIGSNCLLHVGSGIHHDVVLGPHSVLMPGAKITCGAQLGKCIKLDTNVCISISKMYNDYSIVT